MDKKSGYFMAVILAVFLVLVCAESQSRADIIIDNGASGTSYTGTWALSGGTNPYGPSSLWSRDGATYTFAMSGGQAGIYEVFMWWSGWSTRAPSVPIAVKYSGGTKNLTVNQLQNAGQWNSLGTFYFDGNGQVTMTAANGATLSTCADAVQFTYIKNGSPPVAIIDSIIPSPANSGELVAFSGHGTDSDGTITGYTWTSSIDRTLSSAQNFSTSSLSSGTHTISFIVTDNDGLTSVTQSTIVIGQASEEVIIDNTDSRTSRTGSWSTSSAPNYYNTGSVWSRDGTTFTWKFTPALTGHYDVSMWWTTSSTRSSSIPVLINNAGGSETVTINQLQNAGQWNSLGTFPFIAGMTYSMTMTSQGSPTSTCADAMKFTFQSFGPRAVIDSISPNPAAYAQAVTFTGHGSGDTITGYEWTSSIDGIIGNEASFATSNLTSGAHAITFTVKGQSGGVSPGAQSTLTVEDAPDDIIIDNTDSRTSREGTWTTSTTSGYYGTGSVWARNGATFTWRFTPVKSGYYRVMMWWTTTSSRSSSVPVTIYYSGGSQVVNINQLENGGQWNTLGTYPFNAGETYSVSLVAQAYPTSTCADAVNFRLTTSGIPAAKFISDQITGSAPFAVQFTDLSAGVITSWAWDFGDGATSTEINPSHTYAHPGKYTVTLTVSNATGSDTETMAQYIRATGDDVEHLYVGDGYSEDATFIPNLKIILTQLGATGQGNLWYYTNNTTGKNYIFHFINTPTGFLNSLNQTNAHIIWNGHSNFGLGGTFAEGDEVYDQEIDAIKYIDDDRFTHISTPMVSVKMDGLLYGQAYPNFTPVYKNGNNGIMPYTFSEGTPPYNYYLTYKVPGDSTLYKIELSDGTRITRFPDCGVTPWYSSTGATPSPTQNPEYFVVNNDTDFNSCNFVGTWPIATDNASKEYKSYTYQYHAAGTGLNSAVWTLVVKHAGDYDVIATWQSSSENASNAKYTINHSGGTSTVMASQKTQTSGYVLGTFYFSKGTYTVTLTDDADGRVVADSIRLASTDGLYTVLADNGYQYKPHFFNGSSPKTIIYGNTAIDENKLKYSRMFYSSCNSCNYYCGNFHRGIMYCTTSDSNMYTALTYIQDYLSGMSDEAILRHLNSYQDIHELINFNLKPPSLR